MKRVALLENLNVGQAWLGAILDIPRCRVLPDITGVPIWISGMPQRSSPTTHSDCRPPSTSLMVSSLR